MDEEQITYRDRMTGEIVNFSEARLKYPNRKWEMKVNENLHEQLVEALKQKEDGLVQPESAHLSNAAIAQISNAAISQIKADLIHSGTTPHYAYPGIESLAYGRPWAILPEKLAVIDQFLRGWMAGNRISAEDLQVQFGAAAPRTMSVAKGVAVLPVYGVIAQRMNMMSAMSGGTSTELLSKQFRDVLQNPEIGTIVFDVDSPGGAVNGVPELAAEIRSARGQKRMIAVCTGLMCSAAYWLGTAADEIVITPSGEAGSIGVYTMHMDYSKQNEMLGRSPTYVSAGKYKIEGNPNAPLSKEALAYTESVVGEYYNMFVKDVAVQRGASKSDVENGFGEGRAVTAKQAVALGMVDRIATLTQVLEKLGVAASAKRALALERRRLEL